MSSSDPSRDTVPAGTMRDAFPEEGAESATTEPEVCLWAHAGLDTDSDEPDGNEDATADLTGEGLDNLSAHPLRQLRGRTPTLALPGLELGRRAHALQLLLS